MCVINQIPARDAALSLQLDIEQVEGCVRLLRNGSHIPSPERLALVVMRDEGLDDCDIAEIFGRSERWAAVVRSQAEEIRSEEHIPERLEFLDENLQPGMPTMKEIYETAARRRPASREPVPAAWTPVNLLWMGDHFAELSECA